MNLNLLGNYVVPSTMIGALSTQMYESQHLDPKMAYSLVGKRRFSKVSKVTNDPERGENAALSVIQTTCANSASEPQ